MDNNLRILVVEDSDMDTTLLLRELRKGGYAPQHRKVETADGMREALETEKWDIVVSDYIMPQFSGPEALKVLQDTGLDIPFIMVSGKVGEDNAVEVMRMGAQDYILKDNLSRLVPAIRRELMETENRRQKRQAEENLIKVNRARDVLIKVNESMLRSISEETLLHTVCRAIVVVGGYRMCWVGYLGQEENRAMLPVAQAGYEAGYLRLAGANWDNTVKECGPIGSAVRSVGPVVVRNTRTDPSFLPCREEAIKRGYESIITLPLIDKERVFGTLNIYAGEADCFDKDEMELLSSLATDLSFGIMALRTREQFDKVEMDLRDMASRLVQLQEEERRSIARELHDQIGQSLTALKLMLNQVIRICSDDESVSLLDESQTVITEIIRQVREMSLKLRPSMLDDLGLLPTLLWYFDHYTRQTQIKVNFEHTGLQRDFSMDIGTAVFRIVQEALTNVARHAEVDEVDIGIKVEDGRVVIQVEDRGTGFDLARLTPRSSTGISGMRERVLLLSGEMVLNSRPGAGTRLKIRLPLDNSSSGV